MTMDYVLARALEATGALRAATLQASTITQHLQQLAQEFSMQSSDLVAALAALDKATTDVGARLADLAAQVKTDMTPEEVAAVVQSINAEAQRLVSFGADPVPVPPAAG